MDEHQENSQRCARPDCGAMEETNGLSVQKAGSHGCRVASCICIIVAVALLVKDADKLTLGQNLIIATPHALEAVRKRPPDRMARYQALLLNPARISSKSQQL